MERLDCSGGAEDGAGEGDEAAGAAAERAQAERRLAERRERARAMMVREFRIEAAFVDVPKLARIVGLASSTIYGYIRARSFFIPYRLVNGRPLISLDDLVDWYCCGSPIDPVAGPPLPTWRPIGPRPAPDAAEPPKTTAQIVEEAKAKLGMASRGPRRGAAR